MKIALISDIHSNLPALEAVIQRIRDLKVDGIYCLGDIVGYGPFPNECVDMVRKECTVVVKGNHDSGAVGETNIGHFNEYGQAAIRWTISELAHENTEFLRSLPMVEVREDLTLVHSSPAIPERWTYMVTLQNAIQAFKAFSTRFCFIGHTHLPLIISEDLTTNSFKKGMRHIINVGSVGQPRDGDPESAFGFYDTVEETYEIFRVPYEIKRTVKSIKGAGLPSFLANRLQRGL